MKKNMLALLLSIVIATGSVGGFSALAAETMPAQENIETEQESEKDEVSDEEDAVKTADQGISEVENSTEIVNAIDDEESETTEEIIIEETETEDVTDESVSMNDDELESAQINTTDNSHSTPVSDAEPSDAAEASLLIDDQIRAFQEKVAIWKNGSSLSVVYLSSDNVKIRCFLYPGNIDDPAEWTELTWSEEERLYSSALDVGGFADNSAKIVLDDGENRFEATVSTAFGDSTVIDAAIQEEEILSVTWPSIEDAEGYLIKVTDTDNTAGIYETSESHIELDITDNIVQEIAMVPFKGHLTPEVK